jgi:hypothetical protein
MIGGRLQLKSYGGGENSDSGVSCSGLYTLSSISLSIQILSRYLLLALHSHDSTAGLILEPEDVGMQGPCLQTRVQNKPNILMKDEDSSSKVL